MKKQLFDFVLKDSVTHLDFLKTRSEFPQICALSTELIASYFIDSIQEGKAELVYGSFGKENYHHAWIEFDNFIMDYTMVQFIVKKEKGNFYKNKSGKELLSYILDKQGTIIHERNPLMNTLYKKIAVIKPELGIFKKAGMSYSDFLLEVSNSEEFKNYYDTYPHMMSGQKYEDYLQENNLERHIHRHLRAAVIRNIV